jgi:Zinc knuckle
MISDLKIILDHLEKFNGNGSFEIWKKKFKMIMKIQGILDPAPYLPFLLTDVPLNMYMELDEKKQSNCEEVLQILDNSFGLTRRSAYSQLINLKYYEGQTIDDYVSQVKMLASKIDDLTKAAFMAGLPFELQLNLEQAGDQDLTEMVEYSRRYLGIKKCVTQSSMSAVQNVGDGNIVSKERGEVSGGKRSSCTKPRMPHNGNLVQTRVNRYENAQRQSNGQIICYKCKQLGHIAKYCKSGNGQGSL